MGPLGEDFRYFPRVFDKIHLFLDAEGLVRIDLVPVRAVEDLPPHFFEVVICDGLLLERESDDIPD